MTDANGFQDPYIDPATGLLRGCCATWPGAITKELRTEKTLKGMGRSQFIGRLSYHYEQFNCIHPFREGNGRTQRVFWNRIAAEAGWEHAGWTGPRAAAYGDAGP